MFILTETSLYISTPQTKETDMTPCSAKSENHESNDNIDGKAGKPKRPLSAYNLFYKFDRERLLNGTEFPATAADVLRLSRDDKNKPKRSHRKTHGKISFTTMSRTISARWKQLPQSFKKVFEDQAAIEKKEYDDKLLIWREQQANSSKDQEDDVTLDEIEEEQDISSVTKATECPTYISTPNHNQGSLTGSYFNGQFDDLQTIRDRVDRALADFIPVNRSVITFGSMPNSRLKEDYSFSSQSVGDPTITTNGVLPALQIWECFGCADPFDDGMLDTLFE